MRTASNNAALALAHSGTHFRTCSSSGLALALALAVVPNRGTSKLTALSERAKAYNLLGSQEKRDQQCNCIRANC
ncbi:hypothetical protein ACN38_g4518 [Penicillium nordicum]|uniref:Uncharacterized protein n=1 Tax=Penicillium nordicum TaxID=229535 RepID=A0A0M8P6K0_9EURO|nr:hypothetical protein ACN38_g4518 [Penicillium nordicum]